MLYRVSSIAILFLVCVASPSYSQEKVTNGRESLETVRAFTKIRPLFIGFSYEQLFPLTLTLNSSLTIIQADGSFPSSTGGSVPFSPIPIPNTDIFRTNSALSFVASPYVVVGTEFPFIFGLSFPVSVDLYTRLGASYRTIGRVITVDNDFLGLSSLDLNADLNVRFIFPVHRYAVPGFYVTTGVGVLYSILKGYGYFPNSFPLNQNNFVDFREKIIINNDDTITTTKTNSSGLDVYVNLGAGILLQQIQSKNFKVIIGYVARWYLFPKSYDDYVQYTQIDPADSDNTLPDGGDRLRLTGLDIFHGIQVEFIYSIF